MAKHLTIEKYSVLPGQEPLRLASIDGHVIIIGETARLIPKQFENEAKGKGAVTEAQLQALADRLGTPVQVPSPDPTVIVPASPSPSDQPDLTGTFTPSGPPDPKRAEQIRLAVIDMLNAANPSDIDGRNGKPKIDILRNRLGFEITVEERDAAFEAAKG